MKSRYDVVILGAGHNGLVAAAYLARAGLSVLVLEKNDYLGGATTSQRLFPEYEANLSRYSYLVSLFPEKIIRDLGLKVELRRRAVGSCTPYQADGRPAALVASNTDEARSRESLRALTGSDGEFARLQQFYGLVRQFADRVWDTMLEPLPSREALRQRFTGDADAEAAWRMLVEEPLGMGIERHLSNDLLRGVVFTDGKIGLLTHPHDETRLQNRCFLYHLMGNRTGEWKVPVGGMGRLAGELERAARSSGAELLTGARIGRLDLEGRIKAIEFEHQEKTRRVDARFVLVNCGLNVLHEQLGRSHTPDATHEGSVFKINLLCRRLPRLNVEGLTAADGFTGTFHIDEGYEAMKVSHGQATAGQLPDRIPCEVYCHTLTDDSILSSELRQRGFHTLTLFALDVPWRLFSGDPVRMKREAEQRCLAGLNQWLVEPVKDCLAMNRDGSPCLESKSPVDIERELGHYRGNIFHGALTWPFAGDETEAGTWGVETEWPGVYRCGSSASRGGAVSGIPGHNAARKVLESVGLVQ